MNARRIAFVLSTAVAAASIVETARAQLPGAGVVGSANSQAQAQVQQRAQAQVQARAQAQVQQQVQAQTQAQVRQVQAQAQARLQAEAARAAHIAQQATIAAQQAAAAAQRQAAAARPPAGVNARLGANASVHNQSRIANQPASATAYARLGIDVGIRLPPGITEADVRIYDHIFGRFNPLRPQPAPQSSASPAASEPEPQQQTANRDASRSPRSADSMPANPSGLELSTRIQVAVRERRAEISQLRDRALAAGDVTLMQNCEQMETAMNAFVAAQARTNAQSEAAAANRPNETAPGSPPQGPGHVPAQDSAGGANNQPPASPPAASTSDSGNANGNGPAGKRR